MRRHSVAKSFVERFKMKYFTFNVRLVLLRRTIARITTTSKEV